jgi:hypothetical protein
LQSLLVLVAQAGQVAVAILKPMVEILFLTQPPQPAVDMVELEILAPMTVTLEALEAVVEANRGLEVGHTVLELLAKEITEALVQPPTQEVVVVVVAHQELVTMEPLLAVVAAELVLLGQMELFMLVAVAVVVLVPLEAPLALVEEVLVGDPM